MGTFSLHVHAPRRADRRAVNAHALLLRAPSLAVLNVCVGRVRSLHAHTAPPSHTESIESAQVLSSMVPCWHSGSTRASLS
jgi:hypothetical protein